MTLKLRNRLLKISEQILKHIKNWNHCPYYICLHSDLSKTSKKLIVSHLSKFGKEYIGGFKYKTGADFDYPNTTYVRNIGIKDGVYKHINKYNQAKINHIKSFILHLENAKGRVS